MKAKRFLFIALLAGAAPLMAEEKTTEKCLEDEYNECITMPVINIEKEDF